MNSARGYVLQATYRIQNGVPVVYLYGRLESGETFEIRDTQQVPVFYVEREVARGLLKNPQDPRLQVPEVKQCRFAATDKRNFNNQRLTQVQVGIPSEAPKVRDWLHARDVKTYEADVRFAQRFLIDRDIKCGIQIDGPREPGRHVRWLYENPQVAPARVAPVATVLSFDIETNPTTDRLLAIACYCAVAGETVDEVVVVDPQNRPMPKNAIGVETEKDALHYFCQLVQRLDPDILTGWNVIDFDLRVLQGVAQRVRYDMQLGRGDGEIRIRAAEGYFGSGSATLPGRLVLDGMDLVRGAFVKLDDYSLDGVSQAILGEGKTLSGKGDDKVAEILRTYAHDLEAFSFYARTDARLALRIVEKLDLFNLAFARSALTGMTADRVAASIASFDFLYLAALEKQRIAAPSVAHPGQNRIAQGGGAVFEPLVGIHENVWVCDFKSLYPSIMRTFNIDPLTFAQAENDEPNKVAIKTVDGTAFSTQPGILPRMLDDLFTERAAAKATDNQVASQAIKILMNSFYGVLGTPSCRFYNPHIANAITSQGRALLSWSKQWFQARGYVVLYGDTDSVFVASGSNDAEQAHAEGATLIPAFNAELAAYLADRFQVESKLELEFEKLYTRLFLAQTRGGGQGARKRYAGIRFRQQEVEFVGMEVVRRDWTELAKVIQRNLFTRLFSGEEVVDYLSATVRALRAGELDEQLIYHKGLRKGVETYVANVPPHVQAIKRAQLENPELSVPRIVRYLVTLQGPTLVAGDVDTLEPDREHYLEKQVKPVAVPVLKALGLDFDQVIGDDRQISMF